MTRPKLRIFVSSPGDVAEERVLAGRALRRLVDEFASRVCIEPVFWEHEPLRATAHFQAQIPRPSECDVVVCILWARLGTGLPSSITRLDGTRYASGTEYEFENAVEGYRRNGHPDLLVYRKTAEAVASLRNRQEVLQRLEQRDALDAFINKWFHSEDGTLRAAFHPFDTASRFEELLEAHIRKLILARYPDSMSTREERPEPTWTRGSPFRGLESFEFEHAPIFFGRSDAVSGVLAGLRTQAADGRPFVLVLGPSGAGKSSLVRAGVLPLLVQPGVIEGVAAWRRAVLRPGDIPGNPFQALAAALLRPEALPELGTTAQKLGATIHDHPQSAAMVLEVALANAASSLPPPHAPDATGGVKLVLLVDQLEELFTSESLTGDDRIRFSQVLSSLVRSGVWVIATLRSDFYPRLSELPELIALKEGAGQYDLRLPTAAEISQMIRLPAQAAGLRFEEHPETRARLDDLLRDAAAANPESLPLLEFALEELYKQRSEHGLLTHAAYQQLGGVEGALAKRAEESFASLPSYVQAALPRVLGSLVSVGTVETASSVAVRRKVPLASVAADEQARQLVSSFVQARLFSTDRASGGGAVVTVAHEALLRNWPRLREWVEQNKEFLRVRGRVSAAAGRWLEEARCADLLLPEGRPLEEARSLLSTDAAGLADGEREFVTASLARALRRKRIKRGSVAALAVLTIVAGTSAYLAFRSRQATKAALGVAQAQSREATLRQEDADSSFQFLKDVLTTAKKGYSTTLLDAADATLAKLQTQTPAPSPRAKDQILITLGETYRVLGQYDKAETQFRDAWANHWHINPKLDDLESADIFQGLAQTLGWHSNADDPRIYFYWTKVLEIRRRLLGDDDPLTRHTKLELGNHQILTQSRPEGERIILEAVRPIVGRGKSLEEVRAELLAEVDEVRYLWQSGDRDRLKSYLDQILRPFLQDPIAVENASDAIATLAFYELRRGDEPTANALGHAAIVVSEELNGPEDPRHAKILAHFGYLLAQRHRSEEGVGMLRRAVNIARAKLGHLNSLTIYYATQLVQSLKWSGHADEARKTRESMLAEAATGGSKEDRCHVLHILGESVERDANATADEMKQAEQDLSESIALARHCYRSADRRYLECALDLEWALWRVGNFDEADRMCAQMLDDVRRESGSDDTTVALLLDRQGLNLLGRGDPPAAVKMFRQAYEVAVASKADAPEIVDPLRHLADAQDRAGMKADAEQTLDNLVAKDTRFFGAPSAELIAALRTQAAMVARHGDSAKAQALYRRAWDLAVRFSGSSGEEARAVERERQEAVGATSSVEENREAPREPVPAT